LANAVSVGRIPSKNPLDGNAQSFPMHPGGCCASQGVSETKKVFVPIPRSVSAKFLHCCTPWASFEQPCVPTGSTVFEMKVSIALFFPPRFGSMSGSLVTSAYFAVDDAPKNTSRDNASGVGVRVRPVIPDDFSSTESMLISPQNPGTSLETAPSSPVSVASLICRLARRGWFQSRVESMKNTPRSSIWNRLHSSIVCVGCKGSVIGYVSEMVSPQIVRSLFTSDPCLLQAFTLLAAAMTCRNRCSALRLSPVSAAPRLTGCDGPAIGVRALPVSRSSGGPLMSFVLYVMRSEFRIAGA
jgi:hypothetical protein